MSIQSNENPSPPHRPVPMQLQPDLRYTIFVGADENGVKLADVFVVPYGKSVRIGVQTFTGQAGGTEFWFYSNSSPDINAITSATSIYIAAVALADDPTFPIESSTISQTQSVANSGQPWSSTPQQYKASGALSLQSYSFWSTPLKDSSVNWGLELVVKTAESNRMASLFGIQWYRHDPSESNFSGTVDEGAGFTGQWSRGQNWNGPSPYSGSGYFAKTSM